MSEVSLYPALLSDIKARIRQGQLAATRAVNNELTALYWDVGRLIHERQQLKGWGAGIIPKLSRDLANELPDTKGFSERNLKRMLRFYREYAIAKDNESSRTSPSNLCHRLWHFCLGATTRYSSSKSRTCRPGSGTPGKSVSRAGAAPRYSR